MDVVRKYAWLLQLAAILPSDDDLRREVEQTVLERLRDGAEASPENDWRLRAKPLGRPLA